MASPTQWTWVCVDSRSWRWTGRPGVLRFMGSQRVGHDWATKLNWTTYIYNIYIYTAYIYNIYITHTYIYSIYIYIYIYLAVLSLSYRMETLNSGMRDLAPWPEIEPRPPALRAREFYPLDHQGDPVSFYWHPSLVTPTVNHYHLLWKLYYFDEFQYAKATCHLFILCILLLFQIALCV